MSVFIVAAKRTPFGAFGGSLKGFTSHQLGALASTSALESAGLSADKVDASIWGCVMQSTHAGGPYMARHIGLSAGMRVDSNALTVNRLCGSGFQSIINGVQEIKCGDANIVLTGGSENMSQAPYMVRNSRFGIPLGVSPEMEDSLWKALADEREGCKMGDTAENLAEQYNITREEADALALLSQQRYAAALEAGNFDAEICPVEVKVKRATKMMDADEHPRPQSTAETLAKLSPVFKKNGTVTAANASGICDGAGAIVLANDAGVADNNLKPLARIVSYQVSGVEPSIMGIGPVPAMQGALAKANLTLDDMDLIEVNEAFAVQFLACQKELGLDMAKTNTSGGAIAMGHPIGASGARIMTHLTHALHRTDSKYAIGAACIGGGQGIAIVLEKC